MDRLPAIFGHKTMQILPYPILHPPLMEYQGRTYQFFHNFALVKIRKTASSPQSSPLSRLSSVHFLSSEFSLRRRRPRPSARRRRLRPTPSPRRRLPGPSPRPRPSTRRRHPSPSPCRRITPSSQRATALIFPHINRATVLLPNETEPPTSPSTLSRRTPATPRSLH